MHKKITMISGENTMYLELFEANKELLDLIQRRGELKEKKDQLRKDTYNNTTSIKEAEEKLKCIVEKLKKKIEV